MNPLSEAAHNTRREFLTTAASGLGGVALSSLLGSDSAQAALPSVNSFNNPLSPKRSHFPAKAKSCIFIFMAGAPSHLDFV